jgi:hypothetical protein
LMLSAGFAAALLLVPAMLASLRRARRTGLSLDTAYVGLALCGAVSLLSVRHLSYDFIVLWPALVAWRAAPFSADPRRYAPAAAFWALATALVIGLPGWVRAAVAAGAPEPLLVLTEADRVVALAAWAYLSWRNLK